MKYFEISVIDEWHKILYVENLLPINTKTAVEIAIRELIVLWFQAKQKKYEIFIVRENKSVLFSKRVGDMLMELEEKSRSHF